MHPLTVSELLDVWDRGASLPSVERALVLLASSCPEASRDDLALLTIGQRDGRILTLREWTFGRQVNSLVSCPVCRETIELTFNTSDVRFDAVATPESSLAVFDYDVTFRPPDSNDLAFVDARPAASSRRLLFERCLLSANRGGVPVGAEEVPDEIVSAVAARLAENDPQADVRLEMLCPFCGAESNLIFDIVSFFWTEIEAWARRTLREVHLLARAYGWNETEILALSARRRHLYLEMAAA